jgi:uncharacterized metal-binding protein
LNNELERAREGKLEGLSHYIFALDGCWDCQIVKCLDKDNLRGATTSLVDGDFVVNKRLKKEYHPKD